MCYNNGNGRGQQKGSFQKPNYESNHISAEKAVRNANFKESWITTGADAALPDFAEKLGKDMARNNLTSSKIRSIYGEIKRIQMGGFEKEKASFYLLRPKMAYAVGRDRNNYGLHLFRAVFDISSQLVRDADTFRNFCNLIEAVLAYHKAYCEKDD